MPYFEEPFVRKAGEKVIIDPTMANFEIINYKIVNNIYQSKTNVIDEYKANGLNVTDDTDYTTPKDIKLISRSNSSFKDLFDLYCKLKDIQPKFSYTPDYQIELIENINPFVMEAYDKLGQMEVMRLKYHITNIKREIIKKSNKSYDYKIALLLEDVLPLQKAIPLAEVKSKLQAIYDDLDINAVAKGVDVIR